MFPSQVHATASSKHGGRSGLDVQSGSTTLKTSSSPLLATRPVSITQPGPCDWTQASGPRDRSACLDASDPRAVVARVVGLDPNVANEIDDAEAFGWGRVLLARSSTPLIVGDDVYLQVKGGSYTPCSTVGPEDECGSNLWSDETWGVAAYRWETILNKRQLVKKWQYNSGWSPLGGDGLAQQWEPLFQPVIVGSYLYVPDAGGTIHKVDRSTGRDVARIVSPLDGGNGDVDTGVSGALSADAAGNVYYTVIALQPRPASVQASPRNSWLVKVAPDNTMTSVSIPAVTPADGPCQPTFAFTTFLNPPFATPLPWPPAPGATAPAFNCGAIRPALNAAPLVSADGSTVYTYVRTRLDSDHAFVVALHTSDLGLAWSRSLRGFLNDDCGVLTPSIAVDGDTSDDLNCKVGSTVGVDRTTGLRPGARSLDLSVATLQLAPDGAIIVGAYTPYDNERGHTMVLNADGTIRAAFNFGWNHTAGIRKHDGTYSMIVNNSHYDAAPFNTTSLSPAAAVEWSTANMNDQLCTRAADGTVSCVSVGLGKGDSVGQHNRDCTSLADGSTQCADVAPGGGLFDFVSRSPFVDRAGNVWAASSDGNLYQVDGADGHVVSRIFVDSAQSSNDVPIAADASGRIYVIQNGALAVIGASTQQ